MIEINVLVIFVHFIVVSMLFLVFSPILNKIELITLLTIVILFQGKIENGLV